MEPYIPYIPFKGQIQPNLAENKTAKSYQLPPPSNKDKGGLEPQCKA